MRHRAFIKALVFTGWLAAAVWLDSDSLRAQKRTRPFPGEHTDEKLNPARPDKQVSDLTREVAAELPQIGASDGKIAIRNLIDQHLFREALGQIRVPLLALNGSLDQTIAPEENLSEIKRLTQAGKNPAVTVLKLYGLNHLFQSATTGAPAEMMRLEETFSTKALEIITAWIRARAKLDQ